MKSILLGMLMLLAPLALAHQPVQDMAPRWAGGYGFQIRQEYRSSDDLLDGSSDAPNPFGRKERVRTTWLEGVYTFDKSVRITAKLPWVDQERVTTTGQRQAARGLGDITLGVPLKVYWNDGAETGNWSFTPSVRLPTGSTGGDYPIDDGSWDFGASFAYSRETPSWYELVDLFYWKNGSGRKGINRGDLIGLDVNLGIHPLHSDANNSGVFLMWDLTARYEARGKSSSTTSGGKRIHTGPVAVGYWNNWMIRAEYKFPVYEKVWSSQLARGPMINLIIGVAF